MAVWGWRFGFVFVVEWGAPLTLLQNHQLQERQLTPQEWRTSLTSLDRRSENVRVLPIVITELEFGNMGKANGSDEISLCQQTREAWVKSL